MEIQKPGNYPRPSSPKSERRRVGSRTGLNDWRAGIWKRKRSFFYGSRSAKNLPLPHRLFDLKSNLAKKFCPFPNVD